MYEAIKWPEDMTPSRSPIHFTNELEVAASPERSGRCSWIRLPDPDFILALSMSNCWTGTHRNLGRLEEGGALVQARERTWTHLIFQDLFKKEQ